MADINIIPQDMIRSGIEPTYRTSWNANDRYSVSQYRP